MNDVKFKNKDMFVRLHAGTTVRHQRCVIWDTNMEATWRGSLQGLLERCGGFGGLITEGKGILLLSATVEPAGRQCECI